MLETPGGLVETPIARILVGAIIMVRPGDRVPADGTIVSGTSAVDESALTGESMPRPKAEGDVVLAGSINTEAALRVRVDKPTEDTVIARVVKLVEEAADAKARRSVSLKNLPAGTCRPFACWHWPLPCCRRS